MLDMAQTDQLGHEEQEKRDFHGQAKAAHLICHALRWDISQTSDEYS